MITTATSKQVTTGNSVATTFTIPFKFLDPSHITISIINDQGVSTTLVLNVDYTLTGAGAESGGTAELVAPPLSTEIVTIVRYVSPLQLSDYINSGRLAAQNIESDLDYLTMLVQQSAEGITDPGSAAESDLAIKFPNNEPSTTSRYTPTVVARSNKIAGWNAIGEFTALDVSVDGSGGLIGPASQVTGNLPIYSGTQGVVTQDAGIDIYHLKAQNLVYAASVLWNRKLGQIATLELGGNPTLNISNLTSGQFTLILNQDSTGNRVITFGSMFNNAAGIFYSKQPNSQSIIQLVCDGSFLYPIANSLVSDQTGSIQDFGYNIAPVENDIGYLLCDGEPRLISQYQNLYDRIGTAFQYTLEDDGVTPRLAPPLGEFRTPNLVGTGGFRRASTAAGVHQADSTAKNGLAVTNTGVDDHRHLYLAEDALAPLALTNGGTNEGNIAEIYDAYSGGPGEWSAMTELDSGHDHKMIFNVNNTYTPIKTGTTTAGGHNHTAAVAGDTETRPINMGVVVGIKF